MPQNVFERELATPSSSGGGSDTVDLPRSHYYQRLALLLDWDITVDNTSAAKNRAGILEAIQDIQVTINGNQTIKAMDLEFSHLIDQFQYGTKPVKDTIDFSTASQQTGQVATFVDFLIRPDDVSAMLPSFETSDMTLDITWGDASDIEEGGDHITINDLTLTVTSQERLRSSVAEPGSQKEEAILSNLMVYKERQKRQTLDAAGETPIDLPRGNTYYATPFRVYDGDAPDNALVERFEIVENGVETHKSMTFDAARQKDVVEYGFDVADLPTGFAYPNFGLKGNLDDVVPTAGMDDFELTVDTGSTSPTDPAEVELLTQEIIR